MKSIPAESVDLIIADPPYNLGKDYGNNNDRKTHDEYIEFSKHWINEAHRILKHTGSIYIFMGVRFISYLFIILEREYNFYFYLDDIRIPQKFYRSINNMRGANPGDVWQFSHVHYCNKNRNP
jgi:site-specific DNA-methyltransferase (adenine-specific)